MAIQIPREKAERRQQESVVWQLCVHPQSLWPPVALFESLFVDPAQHVFFVLRLAWEVGVLFAKMIDEMGVDVANECDS